MLSMRVVLVAGFALMGIHTGVYAADGKTGSEVSIDCATPGSGYSCNAKCPASPTGSSITYVARNCNCKKDTATKTCTPSGKCDEYVNGLPTQINAVDCVCEKVLHSGTGGGVPVINTAGSLQINAN